MLVKPLWTPVVDSTWETVTWGPAVPRLDLKNDKDYIVRIPEVRTVNGDIWGGRQVFIQAAEFSPPDYNVGVRLRNQTEAVWFEGCLAGHRTRRSRIDGIALACPRAHVYVTNSCFHGMHGDSTYFHPDAIQNQGGCLSLHVFNVSASSNYEGFFLPKHQYAAGVLDIGSAEFRRVDFRYWASAQFPNQTSATAFWCGPGEPDYERSEDAYPVVYDNVWVDYREATKIQDPKYKYRSWVFPGAFEGLGGPKIRAVVDDTGWTWPNTPLIQGRVNIGAPSGGPFVSPHEVGLGYRRPDNPEPGDGSGGPPLPTPPSPVPTPGPAPILSPELRAYFERQKESIESLLRT